MDGRAWQAAKELLAEAIDLAPAEQRAYIEQRCADPVLRRELLAMIESPAPLSKVVAGALTLTPGTRLGPYEIVAPIGAGGMGEVYRARDTRLSRDVAIKILPLDVAGDPDRRGRFEREARTISSLNHPHICTLYDVGEQDDLRYLVMELVEGETLAERLQRGALPLARALDLAIEIAGALDAAHRRGIVHRDLKPANIILTKSGAKLLDFGLAKLRATSGPIDVGSTRGVSTARGTIVGTLQYMAPEQLEGRDADARTDIFAFGVVLYEMVTGTRAFTGASQAAVISAILNHHPPDPSTIAIAIPNALDRIVRKCLAKDAEERWQDARDLRDELQWTADQRAQSAIATRSASRTFPATWAIIALLAGFAGIAGFGVEWLRSREQPQPAVAELHLQTGLAPADALLGAEPGELRVGNARPSRTAIALSPDGRLLVFAGIRGSVQQLFRRSLDGTESAPIAGTQGADTPFFSPDGRWIGFWAANTLRKVSVDGGPAVDIASTDHVRGASWGSDDAIVFATGRSLRRVVAGGGAPIELTKLEPGRLASQPFVLPGAEALLYTVIDLWDYTDASVRVFIIKTGESRLLIEHASDARYASTGHLVFARSGQLMAVAFDPVSLQVKGSPIGLVENVMQALNGPANYLSTGAGQFAFSGAGHGLLAYVTGGMFHDLASSLVSLDRKGTPEPLGGPKAHYTIVRLSPDEQRVVASIAGTESALVVFDRARGARSRIPFDGRVHSAIWTPDGKRIVFSGRAKRDSTYRLYLTPADGGSVPELLIPDDYQQFPGCWTPDGDLIFVENHPDSTGSDIMLLSMKERQVRPLLHERFAETDPALSPDGRWLAYVSGESGQGEVYVRPYPALDRRIQISTSGALGARWSRTGRELVYPEWNRDAQWAVHLMRVGILPGDEFKSTAPRRLLDAPLGRLLLYAPVSSFDVSRDGEHIVGTTYESVTSAPPAIINFAVNWFDELRAKVPAK